MKSFLVLAAVISASYGSVDWFGFRAGQNKLPTNLDEAVAKRWKLVEQDAELGVSWYSQEDDLSLLLAFDGRRSCAGVRVVFFKKDVDNSLSAMYANKDGVFEEAQYAGQECYQSTVLFTPQSVLKSGGRRMLSTDEVALGVYPKRGGTYTQLDRDGCENAKKPYTEQGCLDGYGVVFSAFGANSSCESLSPFYFVLHPEETGNLIGFGWLISVIPDHTSPTSYRTVQPHELTKLFPRAPGCLSSHGAKLLTAVDVWLSFEDGLKARCSSADWTDAHCQSQRVKRPDADDIDNYN